LDRCAIAALPHSRHLLIITVNRYVDSDGQQIEQQFDNLGSDRHIG